jgi:hypothetical protein|tara:strand:+ start:90 stop:296 length:207 start_codon:yes stop_codon:yes gene_type:complete
MRKPRRLAKSFVRNNTERFIKLGVKNAPRKKGDADHVSVRIVDGELQIYVLKTSGWTIVHRGQLGDVA